MGFYRGGGVKIFIIGSPWHAIVARSLIKRCGGEVIFVVEQVSVASLQQIEVLLEGYPIHAVFSHDETRFVSIKSKGLISFLNSMHQGFTYIKSEALRLKEYLDADASEVDFYYFNFYSPITRCFLKEFEGQPAVSFKRVEDGVCDYFPFNFMNYNLWQRAAKRSISILLGRHALYSRSCPWLYESTDEYFLFFPGLVGNKWRRKQLNNLLDCKDEIKRICASEQRGAGVPLSDTESKILLLGQTLYEDKVCSLDSELAAYAVVLKDFPGSVYFKPHPRTSEKKLKKLKDLGFDIIDTKLTAECLMSAYDFKAVVGMWSNSIVYSRSIFSLPSYSLAGMMLSSSNESELKFLFKIHVFLKSKFVNDYIEYQPK